MNRALELLPVIDARFVSSNDVPVERVFLTATEWKAFREATQRADVLSLPKQPVVAYTLVLRSDQIDLVMDCATHIQKMLNEGTVISETHRFAGRFVHRKLQELNVSIKEQMCAQS